MSDVVLPSEDLSLPGQTSRLLHRGFNVQFVGDKSEDSISILATYALLSVWLCVSAKAPTFAFSIGHAFIVGTLFISPTRPSRYAIQCWAADRRRPASSIPSAAAEAAATAALIDDTLFYCLANCGFSKRSNIYHLSTTNTNFPDIINIRQGPCLVYSISSALNSDIILIVLWLGLLRRPAHQYKYGTTSYFCLEHSTNSADKHTGLFGPPTK